jgi:6-phosphogluconolactonase (cycloisomerase 2 family)
LLVSMPPIIEEDIVEMAEVTLSVNKQRSKDKERKTAGIMPAAIVMVVVALTGCGQFFIPPTSGGGGSTTNNRVYVANSTTSSLSGFTIGTSTLSAVSGSPLSLGYVPVAAVVTPNNNFIYVAGPGAIYMYTINSDGSLTAPSGGAAVAAVNVVSLDVSPDGQWLFGLDNTQTVLDEFQVNTSTGALSVIAATPYSVSTGTVVPKQVKVSPAGSLVFIALGTGGDIVFTLNTSTGALVNSQTLGPVTNTTSDNALAINSTGAYLYIARSGTSGGLAVYAIGADGALNSISGSPFSTGSQPSSIVLDSTGKYVYVANRGDGTISGFSIGTGSALTALTGSPYASGTGVTSLGVDKSGKYLLAGANGGSPDLSMYSYDATTLGKLNLATSTGSGTDPAGVIAVALTH